MKIWMILLILLLLACGQAAPVMTPTPVAEGNYAEGGGIGLLVEKVEYDGDNAHFLVAITNQRAQDVPYNFLYFSLKDSQSFELDASLLSKNPRLGSGDIAPTEEVRGWVTFENVSRGEYTIIYDTLVILGGYEPLRVKGSL